MEASINFRAELPLTTRLVHGFNSLLIRHPFKGAGRIRTAVGRLMMPLPAEPVACPTLYGFKIIIDPALRPGLDRTIFYNGTYEAGTLNVIKALLRPGDCFCDVGSNIGLMSLVASIQVGSSGKVIAFEPQPETYCVLAENIRLNRCTNVLTINEAIGAESGTATIYSNVSRTASASLIRPNDEITSVRETTMESLADFIRRNGIAQIRMIKVDVEGWELEVLKGAQKLLEGHDAPALCVEYSHLHTNQGGSLEEIYRFVRSVNDYTVLRLSRGKEFPSRLQIIRTEAELPWHDNLFCLRPEHILDLPHKMRPNSH